MSENISQLNKVCAKLEKFPVSYDKIYKLSKKLDLGEYKKIVENAYRIREGEKIQKNNLFKNISYLNQFVEKKIIAYYQRNQRNRVSTIARQS